MRAQLLEVGLKLRKRINQTVAEITRWFIREVRCWLNYHAVPSNSERIGRFVGGEKAEVQQNFKSKHARWIFS